MTSVEHRPQAEVQAIGPDVEPLLDRGGQGWRRVWRHDILLGVAPSQHGPLKTG